MMIRSLFIVRLQQSNVDHAVAWSAFASSLA
jgi:hypothetical protein